MGTILTWFYCLPIADVVVLVVLATVLFLFTQEKFGCQPWWKAAVSAAVLLWLCAAVYTTVMGRAPGGMGQNELIPFHSYRAVLSGGDREIYRSNFMNTVLFYPAGLLTAALLPREWPRWGRIALPWLLLTALSTGIEYAQYAYALGRVEIDDVIHNALGALLGSTIGTFLLPAKA